MPDGDKKLADACSDSDDELSSILAHGLQLVGSQSPSHSASQRPSHPLRPESLVPPARPESPVSLQQFHRASQSNSTQLVPIALARAVGKAPTIPTSPIGQLMPGANAVGSDADDADGQATVLGASSYRSIDGGSDEYEEGRDLMAAELSTLGLPDFRAGASPRGDSAYAGSAELWSSPVSMYSSLGLASEQRSCALPSQLAGIMTALQSQPMLSGSVDVSGHFVQDLNNTCKVSNDHELLGNGDAQVLDSSDDEGVEVEVEVEVDEGVVPTQNRKSQKRKPSHETSDGTNGSGGGALSASGEKVQERVAQKRKISDSRPDKRIAKDQASAATNASQGHGMFVSKQPLTDQAAECGSPLNALHKKST